MCFLIILMTFFSCAHVNFNSEYFKHVRKMTKIYEQSENTVYPNQNFLFLENGFINPEGEFERYSSASGMAIKYNGNTMYGLTAGHWCEFKDDPELKIYADLMEYDYTTLLNNTKVKVEYYGESYDLKILAIDHYNDLCLITWNSEYSKKMKRVSTLYLYSYCVMRRCFLIFFYSLL